MHDAVTGLMNVHPRYYFTVKLGYRTMPTVVLLPSDFHATFSFVTSFLEVSPNMRIDLVRPVSTFSYIAF